MANLVTHDEDGPLSNEELDELGAYLLYHSDLAWCMNLPMLDGYLTDVACNPEPVTASQWLRWIWDTQCGTQTPAFATPLQGTRIVSLIVRHMNGIVATLEEAPQRYVPRLLQDPEQDKSVVAEWCCGFIAGITLDWGQLNTAIASHAGGLTRTDHRGTDERQGRHAREQTVPDACEATPRSLADAVRNIHALLRTPLPPRLAVVPAETVPRGAWIGGEPKPTGYESRHPRNVRKYRGRRTAGTWLH